MLDLLSIQEPTVNVKVVLPKFEASFDLEADKLKNVLKQLVTMISTILLAQGLIIKLLTAVNYKFCKKLECFQHKSDQPSLMLVGSARSLP